MFPSRSAPMSPDSPVPRCPSRSVGVFQSKNAGLCPGKLAEQSPESSALLCQSRSASQFPRRSAPPCPDRPAGLCPKRHVFPSPGSSALMFPDRSVLPCPGRSAPTCPASSAGRSVRTSTGARNVSNKRYDDQKTEIFKQQNRVTRAYTSILILVSLNSFPIPLLLSKLVSCQNQYVYQSIIL